MNSSVRGGWLLGLVAMVLAWWTPGAANAQGLQYTGIDRATVRVLALGLVDLQDVEVHGEKYRLASPIGGHGSGVVVSTDGLIVTAAHVVGGARAVAVLAPGVLGPMPARVVSIDETRDVALLRVEHTFEAAATLAPPGESLAIRQTVFAVGYPLDVTRTDPQSNRGSVSGLLPDGRLQLDISVNPGNSGGPVVDEKDRVFGVMSARGNVEKGVVGVGVAIPLEAFRAKIVSEQATPAAHAATDDDARMADLVSVVAHEGSAMMLGSLDANAERRASSEREVRRLVDAMPQSADASLLGAAFFWNRHVSSQAREEEPNDALKQARELAKRAAQLEPQLQTKSAFVQHILSTENPSITNTGGEKKGSRRPSGPGYRVHFDTKQKRSSLYVKRGETTVTAREGMQSVTISAGTYEKLCELPCDANLPSGEYYFAMKQNETGGLVRVEKPVNLSGPTNLQASYQSASGVRALGIVMLIASSVAGVALIATNAGTECSESPSSSSYYSTSTCTTDNSNLLLGTALGLGGSAIGVILMTRHDSAVVGPAVGAGASVQHAQRQPLGFDLSFAF